MDYALEYEGSGYEYMAQEYQEKEQVMGYGEMDLDDAEEGQGDDKYIGNEIEFEMEGIRGM